MTGPSFLVLAALGVNSHSAVEQAAHHVLQEGVAISGVRLREIEPVALPAESSSGVRPTGELGSAGGFPNGEFWLGAELHVPSAGLERRYRLEVDAVAWALRAVVPLQIISGAWTGAQLASDLMPEDVFEVTQHRLEPYNVWQAEVWLDPLHQPWFTLGEPEYLNWLGDIGEVRLDPVQLESIDAFPILRLAPPRG